MLWAWHFTVTVTAGKFDLELWAVSLTGKFSFLADFVSFSTSDLRQILPSTGCKRRLHECWCLCSLYVWVCVCVRESELEGVGRVTPCTWLNLKAKLKFTLASQKKTKQKVIIVSGVCDCHRDGVQRPWGGSGDIISMHDVWAAGNSCTRMYKNPAKWKRSDVSHLLAGLKLIYERKGEGIHNLFIYLFFIFVSFQMTHEEFRLESNNWKVWHGTY